MSHATLSEVPHRVAPFPPFHRWDRDFFFAFVMLIWVGILAGFGIDLAHHFGAGHVAYPPIVAFHAVAFAGWLVVLTAQVLLIRTARRDVHRRLGVAAIALAIGMVVLGPATAIAMQRAQLGTPESDPSFFAAQLMAIMAFAVIVTAAFVLRGDPSAHKRLMLLATLAISDAGFARWLGGGVRAILGHGFWSSYAQVHLGGAALILLLGGFDLITRRRLHPAYLTAAIGLIGAQLAAVVLQATPSWTPVALELIGR